TRCGCPIASSFRRRSPGPPSGWRQAVSDWKSSTPVSSRRPKAPSPAAASSFTNAKADAHEDHVGWTGGARHSRSAPPPEPGSPGAVGTDDAQQMVCHLSESLRMTLGELAATAKHLPIRYPPLKQLVVNFA